MKTLALPSLTTLVTPQHLLRATLPVAGQLVLLSALLGWRERRHLRLHHRPPPPRPRAFPALAVGAMALGALAVGRLAIGRLALGKAELKKVHIRSLQVDALELPSERT